jgi:hypothetical protein
MKKVSDPQESLRVQYIRSGEPFGLFARPRVGRVLWQPNRGACAVVPPNRARRRLRPRLGTVDINSGLSGTPVTESFNPPLPCGGDTGDSQLDGNEQFSDHIVYCGTSPLTCSGTTTQTLKVADFQVRTNTITDSASGVSYTSNGPSQ